MLIFRVFTRNMTLGLMKLKNNTEVAEARLNELRIKLNEVRKSKVQDKVKELSEENLILSEQIVKAKTELIKLETSNGKKQYSVPNKKVTKEVNPIALTDIDTEAPIAKKEKKDSVKKIKENKEKCKESSNDTAVDVRKLDFRIGKILEITRHPNADTLYVEKIDCGEATPRTVVSGLVNHVPIDEMKDKIVMILCNLKPVKMRGVTSEAMVMCASSSEKVEVLLPPSGATPGDLVTCDGYPREPEPQLNPKKKIFETCALDLKTNDDKVACYKGSPLVVHGKGPVVAPTLTGVQVK